MKNTSHLIAGVLGLAVSLIVVYFLDIFTPSLIAIFVGFYLLGLAMPALMDKWVGYGHTIWVPIGFTVSGVLGLYAAFGEKIIKVLITLDYCGIPPCFAFGLLFLAFFIGNASDWGAILLQGKELDLLGAHESKKRAKKEE